MNKQKGFTLIELMIGISILTIILSILFSVFSYSYATSRNQISKHFIETQEKLIHQIIQEEFNKMTTISLPAKGIKNINKNSNDPFQDTTIQRTCDYSTLTGNHLMREIGGCFMVTEGGNEIRRTPECIDMTRSTLFTASFEDRRYIRVRMFLIDPNNPDYPAVEYEETFFAPNVTRES